MTGPGAKRPFGRTQGHPRARSGRVFLDARQAKNDGSYSVAVYAGRAPTSTGVTISDFANPPYRPSVNAPGSGVP